MKNVLATHAFTVADWCELAQAWTGEGQMGRAGVCYRAALDLDPDSAELWFMLAHCQTEVGMLAQAARSLRHVLVLDPRYGEARTALVHVLLRQGKSVDAFQVWWDGKKRRQVR
jgi:cytochrome c-type biogenesis protein CcmH/NrfG